MREHNIPLLLFCLLLTGCAGWSRGCSSFTARNFGGDWLIITRNTDGSIQECWKLPNTSVSNEEQSDGIYWKDTTTGHSHLFHLSGWYRQVQVADGDYAGAARLLGVDLKRCVGGLYAHETPTER